MQEHTISQYQGAIHDNASLRQISKQEIMANSTVLQHVLWQAAV